jgi:nucleoside 2-deoxyribosyltransferase
MKIYIAGPDVFRKDAKEYFEATYSWLKEFGHEAIIPFYPDTHSPQKIFELNCLKIRECDVILANLNQFRGVEPDSGTIWELGYGYAFGKKIIGYDNNRETLAEKTSK